MKLNLKDLGDLLNERAGGRMIVCCYWHWMLITNNRLLSVAMPAPESIRDTAGRKDNE